MYGACPSKSNENGHCRCYQNGVANHVDSAQFVPSCRGPIPLHVEEKVKEDQGETANRQVDVEYLRESASARERPGEI